MDIMIDIETWGTNYDAVVFQIGYAIFNRYNTEEIIHHGTIHIDPVDCMAQGLKVDGDTILWWMHPKRHEGRQVMLEAKAEYLSLVNGLGQLSCVVGGILDGPVTVWANPPQFDLSILKNAYRAIGQDSLPWPHRSERCLRTLCDLAGYDRREGPKPTVAHDAGADAVAQALQCQEAFKLLGVAFASR